MENYYLGLDIGTESVGWAVTDKNYKIVRKKGKSLWGIRLFDTAHTAEERRTFRTNRRRLQRRRQRIVLLQELFAKEIEKVDSKFFQRLKDSAFWVEDKEEHQIYSLFNDSSYTDSDYNKEFKTIYHLRMALLDEEKEFDVRLLYLALHHMMKHRGHFLFGGSVDNATSFENTFAVFEECLAEELGISLMCDSKSEFEKILKDKQSSKTKKCAQLEKLCHIDKTNKQLKEIVKVIVGLKGNLDVIFQEESLKEIEHNKICFSDSNFEDVRLVLEDEIQEKVEIVDIFRSLYNWVILADILEGGEYNGKSFLSVAKVKKYEKHQKDLKVLKELMKLYCQEEYNTFFATNQKNNYCAYVGMYRKNGKKYSVGRCSQEEFYKAVKKLLDKMPQEEEKVQDIYKDIECKEFLPLQVCKDNGVIPYQVNKMEMEYILKNAERYMPFLKEVDTNCGKTVSEKIISLFEFRIPYYVGPLNTVTGENCWMIRKEEGEIRPWNFDEKVDRDASAEKFIKRMTNQCTYLQNETVLPKNSLLYAEYMVLNELNNVRIHNEKLPVELKNKIFDELFKKNKRVTGKMLLDYLNAYGYDLKREDLTGFDGNFKSSLNAYCTLKKIFQDDIDKYSVRKMVEDIVLWITIYGDDQKMLRRVIKNQYGNKLSDIQLRDISRIKFQGWGRLSKRFLSEIEGADCQTGECMTIIQGLRNTQNNLMQLLSQEYTFTSVIEEENAGFHLNGKVSYEELVKDVVGSPSVKRAVWQTVQIVEEIKKVMGGEPQKIFVEMARGEEEKKRTVSRKDKLLEAYAAIDKEMKMGWSKELEGKAESDFKSIKLFLYYTQMGQCMYSGEKIDLSQLNDATIWDRDHIYPQSKTKDDSLDNLVLVKRDINAKKSDGMISPQIQSKMHNTWKYLKEKGLISEKKYERLTRKTPLTDEELAGFINRQLVETRQSSKIVATLLKRIYDTSEIVYVKAGAVSDYRKEYVEGVKVREVNDYHHAKDAYLNIVVGNVFHTKFTSNPLRWIRENPNAKYSLNQMYNFDLKNGQENVWIRGKDGTRKIVNQTLNRNDILFTRYAYCNKGGLFDQNIVKAPKDKEKAKILIPIKQGMEAWKYGGYNSITPSYFMLVESKDKKGNFIRTIETVPLYKIREFRKNEKLLIEYCKEFYGLVEPRIVIPCIKKNAKLVINGFPMHLKGSTGKQLILQGAVQLCLDDMWMAYMKKIEKYINENAQRKDKSKLLQVNDYMGITREENIELYDVFIGKFSNSIYQYRPANPKEKLIERKEKFAEITIEEQCIVLAEILHLFQCKPVTANLSLIGAPAAMGKVQIGKEISKCKSIKLISQSPTGVFERVIDLQKI